MDERINSFDDESVERIRRAVQKIERMAGGPVAQSGAAGVHDIELVAAIVVSSEEDPDFAGSHVYLCRTFTRVGSGYGSGSTSSWAADASSSKFDYENVRCLAEIAGGKDPLPAGTMVMMYQFADEDGKPEWWIVNASTSGTLYCKADVTWATSDGNYASCKRCTRDGTVAEGETSKIFKAITGSGSPPYAGISAGDVFAYVPYGDPASYEGLLIGVPQIPAGGEAYKVLTYDEDGNLCWDWARYA